LLLGLLVIVNKTQFDSVELSVHTLLSEFGASQSPPLKFVTSSLGPIMSEPLRDYWVSFDTICNNPRKALPTSALIRVKLQLRLLIIVNKTQFNLVGLNAHTHLLEIGTSQYL
jgi:hypothetical protein